MAHVNDRPTHDLDDGTWHHGDQVETTLPPGSSAGLKNPESGSTEEPSRPATGTVAGEQRTPPPFSTSPGQDSAESDEVTPRPAGERTDEWDIIPAPTIKEGEVVFGKYLLEEKLGVGGMGQVWLVENVSLQRESALKLVRPEYAQNDKGWKRFEREARLMAKITHPNAVAIYDFRRSQSMGYIEMEFVPGRSLEKFLKENANKPMPLEWTAQLLDQLCSVLQVAHGYVDRKTGKAKPIIHRDLKPSNLMLVDGKPDGQNLKVLDFGIAKMVQDEGSPELTGQGDLVGTPYYMSPEQIQGGVGKDGRGELDGRSDLYSVGVLLYQLLTGTLPFWGRTKMEVLVAHLHQTPRPMSKANPEVQVPPKVERLVMSCLERDPDLRPRNARELAEKFRAAIGDIPRPRVEPRPRPVPMPTAVVVAAVLMILALGALFATRTIGLGRNSTGSKAEDQGRTTPPSEPGENPLKDTHSGSGVPPGYEPLTAKDLEAIALDRGEAFAPGRPATDLGGMPAGLKHKVDRVIYYGFAQGIYLPLGYRPEDSGDTLSSWPKALVRQSDKVRFIRITGGRYTAGDFRAGIPADDAQGNSLLPHDVELSGFYIQEAEVTNREIKEYQATFPDEPDLEKWKDGCQVLAAVKTPDEIDSCPAVCINRLTAQRYARRVGGRLPTEAEWEYAARSGGKNNQWASSSTLAAKRRPPKAHLLSAAAPDPNPFPLPVKAFSEDQTDQKVFDMTGNVQEWCLDAYRPYAKVIPANLRPGQPWQDPRVGEADPAEPTAKYVVRGGSSLVTANEAMVFQRTAATADSQLNYLGFRVVLPCPPEFGEPGE